MGTKIVDRGYKKLKKNLNVLSGVTIVVGVIGGVEYAGYLEFGTSRMPPRPFMRQTFDRHAGKMEKQIEISYSSILGGASPMGEANRLGVFYQGFVQKTITGGSFAALDPKTIARKGSSKPLIDTGRLLGSIKYEIR